MDDYGGRPHWGKLHGQTAATLRERYPRVGRLRRRPRPPRPGRHVRNDYLDRVLGPIST